MICLCINSDCVFLPDCDQQTNSSGWVNEIVCGVQYFALFYFASNLIESPRNRQCFRGLFCACRLL